MLDTCWHAVAGLQEMAKYWPKAYGISEIL